MDAVCFARAGAAPRSQVALRLPVLGEGLSAGDANAMHVMRTCDG
jgi:hypothetical protein